MPQMRWRTGAPIKTSACATACASRTALTDRDRGTVCLRELRLRGPDHRPVCIYRQTRRATGNAGDSTGSGAAHWPSLEHRWASRNVSAVSRCLRLRSREQRAVPGPRRQVERRSLHRSPWRSGSHGGVFRGVSEAVSSHRPEESLATVDDRDDAAPASADERRRARCFIRELLLTFSLSSTTCDSAWLSRGFSVIKHV